jgi:predicted small secreted protein
MKRSNIVIIVLVLVTLFLTGCTGGGGGKPQDYSVSGKIVDSNGNGIPNVTLGFSGSFGVATTDNNGKWSKVGLNGNVTITPVKDGWTFETKKVTKADSNVNFIGIRRTYPVVVTTSGEGKVNQEVAVSASSTQYEHGTQVKLTAVPETGWRFSHWEGDLTGSTNPATILVDSEKSITAVFVKMEYALNITVNGEGTVNEDVVISALSTEYEHGTQVQLTAVPETGWRFSHWEGDLTGSTNPATLLVDSEKSITAVFVKMEYALNISIQGEVTSENMSGVVSIIERRINALGVSEPLIQRQGSSRIIVELPGIHDQQQAIDTVGRTALLEFKDPSGQTVLDGSYLKQVQLGTDRYGQPAIDLEFDREGVQLFALLTTRHQGQATTIVLDGEVLQTVMIREPILEGRAQITGGMTVEEARHMVVLLQEGSLPVPMQFGSS